MRLTERNMLLELVDTVVEGVEYCRNASNNAVLKDCHDALVYIENFLNNEPDVTADDLDNIEEIINKLLGLGDGLPTKDELSELKEIIVSLTCNLIVVFLPCMASEWESYNELWNAVKDDEYCMSYIMPVTYLRKEDNINIEYDGTVFPEELPITNHTSFEMDVIKPDIAFINGVNMESYPNDMKYAPSYLTALGAMVIRVPDDLNNYRSSGSEGKIQWDSIRKSVSNDEKE